MDRRSSSGRSVRVAYEAETADGRDGAVGGEEVEPGKDENSEVVVGGSQLSCVGGDVLGCCWRASFVR